ncbi:hypothetical protein GEMRC1_005532 [Eukaryota sp. GEM-RC1]
MWASNREDSLVLLAEEEQPADTMDVVANIDLRGVFDDITDDDEDEDDKEDIEEAFVIEKADMEEYIDVDWSQDSEIDHVRKRKLYGYVISI